MTNNELLLFIQLISICLVSTNNVINLEDGAHTLCSQCDGRGGNQERLKHILINDVADASLEM